MSIVTCGSAGVQICWQGSNVPLLAPAVTIQVDQALTDTYMTEGLNLPVQGVELCFVLVLKRLIRLTAAARQHTDSRASTNLMVVSVGTVYEWQIGGWSWARR